MFEAAALALLARDRNFLPAHAVQRKHVRIRDSEALEGLVAVKH